MHPRHPVVCALDAIGVVCAAAFIWYRPEPSLLILPLAMIAQYGVSFLYHWQRYSRTEQTADHLLIAVLIAATYAQFWLRLLPPVESAWRIIGISALAAIVIALRLRYPRRGVLRGFLYFGLGLAGLAMMASVPAILPPAGWAIFLAGVGLYFVELVVFALERPDPKPRTIGYRGVQHALLIAASATHLIAMALFL